MSIATVLAEGRLIRGAYAQTAKDGRQLLCALTALYDDPNARPGRCDAHLCPEWLQHLLPWIDDAGTEERWPGFMQRLAAIAPRFAGMDEATSRKLDLKCRRIALIEALPHDTAGVVQPVIDLIDRELRGDAPTTQEWAAARESTWVAGAAAWAVARAAARAAGAVAWTAARAAAEESAAADRIIDAMLAEMERAFMTLLDEYRALPDRTLDDNNLSRMYEAMGESPRAMAIEAHIDSAHAVIRLLTKALREARPCVHYTAMDMGLGGECSALLADVDALLTAVERDFKEGA